MIEISLSYMDRLMMGCFSPTFSKPKKSIKPEISTFYSIDLHYFCALERFMGYENRCM